MTDDAHKKLVEEIAIAIRRHRFARNGRLNVFDPSIIMDTDRDEAKVALALAGKRFAAEIAVSETHIGAYWIADAQRRIRSLSAPAPKEPSE